MTDRLERVRGWRGVRGPGRTIRGLRRPVAMSSAVAIGLAVGATGLSVGTANAATQAGSPSAPLSSSARPDQAGPPLNTVFAANSGGYTVSGYPTSSNGNVAPSYDVGGASTSPNLPAAVATDSAGDLWVANRNSNSIAEYAKGQLGASGPIVPVNEVLSNGFSLAEPDALAFDATGDLWVANAADSVVEYTASQLAAGGVQTPAVTLDGGPTNVFSQPAGLAFDATGDLWVDNGSSQNIVELTPGELAAGGVPTPAVTITSPPHLTNPGAMAFDSSGDLWVPNGLPNELVAFTPSQLAAGGQMTPSILLAGPFNLPTAVSFDASHNMWVTNGGSVGTDADTVVELTPAQYAATGTPVPPVVLSATGPGATASLYQPSDLAFDSSGTMWVSNPVGSTVSGFTSAQRQASGSPAPAVQLTPAYGLESSSGVAFDGAGNLWVSDLTARAIEAFTPAQVAAGATRPAIVVATPNEEPDALAFSPSGDLWVGYTDGQLAEFSPAQLAQSGAPTPVGSIDVNNLSGVSGMAFDASGDLWVSFQSFLFEYTAAQLAAGGAQSPSVILSPNGTFLPQGLTFDAAGDLWATNPTTNTVVEFSPAQLASSNSQPPAVTLSATTGVLSLNHPEDVVFDHSGNLWVANGNGPSLVSFSPAELTTSGSPVPASTISGSATGLIAPSGLAVPPTSQRATQSGYWEVASDGGIFSFGNHPFYGSMGGKPLNAPVVGVAPTPVVGPTGGKGYWEVASDGGVFAFGDAQFYGSMGGKPLNKPMVGLAAVPGGGGYWTVASDGGIFAFGDAGFYGSTGSIRLNQPVVGMAATPDGKGYWLVAADGGIFAFGDAGFYGSTGSIRLNQPVVGMAATPDGKGYWLVAADGGIFAFGDAGFYGSTGSIRLNQPVVGMAPSNDGAGYWLVAADGGIFAYGDAQFAGSMGGVPLNKPVVGMAS